MWDVKERSQVLMATTSSCGIEDTIDRARAPVKTLQSAANGAILSRGKATLLPTRVAAGSPEARGIEMTRKGQVAFVRPRRGDSAT